MRMDDLVGRTRRKGKLKRPRLLPRLPVEFRALTSEELMPVKSSPPHPTVRSKFCSQQKRPQDPGMGARLPGPSGQQLGLGLCGHG